MAGLTNIFGGNDDSSSSNDSNFATDTVADASSMVGLDVNSSQSNYSEDEDGNISSTQNDNSLGLDADTDGLLGNMTDLVSSSDQTTE
ncbi:hypothetical protein JW805_12270 [Roseomonas aeriglobus]|nr:hypothetical protein [Roseomonas aeriglobus]